MGRCEVSRTADKVPRGLCNTVEIELAILSVETSCRNIHLVVGILVRGNFIGSLLLSPFLLVLNVIYCV